MGMGEIMFNLDKFALGFEFFNFCLDPPFMSHSNLSLEQAIAFNICKYPQVAQLVEGIVDQ